MVDLLQEANQERYRVDRPTMASAFVVNLEARYWYKQCHSSHNDGGTSVLVLVREEIRANSARALAALNARRRVIHQERSPMMFASDFA